MATEMEVKVIKTETIKPSYPTPDHLRSLKLSLLDQFAPFSRSSVLLFFPRTSTEEKYQEQRSQLLEKSISQTLTSFYPLGGRIRDNSSIHCNDEGAEFIETRVNCSMSMVLEKPDSEKLKQLIPNDTIPKELCTSPLLLVKASFFNCGGMAIGLCFSHKITDASTVHTFLSCWAATSVSLLGSGIVNSAFIPQFSAAALFPPHDSLASMEKAFEETVTDKISVSRLVFHGPRIAALKSKVASFRVQNPTRVEAVLALIWKVALEASRSNSGSKRPSVLFQAVNIRKRVTVVPLPETLAGNLSWNYAAKFTDNRVNEEIIELQDLIVELRKGIEDFKENCEKKIEWPELCRYGEEFKNMVKNGDNDIYLVSSLCRLPIYGVEFGWGKPSWVCIPNLRSKNVVMLADTRDGEGIEVLLSLREEDMALFERNQELLAFASLNSSIL